MRLERHSAATFRWSPGSASLSLWKQCHVLTSVLSIGIFFPLLSQAAPSETDLRFFENNVRPLLISRCISCHGADKSEAGLRLDSREAIFAGSDKGPIIVKGSTPEQSRLIQTVTGELSAPAPCRLKSGEAANLAHWIATGLSWPKDSGPISSAGKKHWAFQDLELPKIPTPKGADRVVTPVDAFIAEKLEQKNLQPSPEADRRTLIRRVSFTLTGLPPSREDVTRFVNDENPEAYEQLVDRLLDSEHYGEQWARHWLDVARYSDTKGYVYAREERFWTHAWTYRDWIVQALNKDLPYDQFLLLQIAADQAEGGKKEDLAAMGLLTLGRRFLGVTHEIIDDRIDVLTRGTMGLTVACARCHDHMYDPIPTQDYYSLYSVFASSSEKQVVFGDSSAADEPFWVELKKRQDALREQTVKSHKETSDRIRNRITDYLHAQTELEKYPSQGFDQIFSHDDILPAFVRQWAAYLNHAENRKDPIFIPWNTFVQLPPNSFSTEASTVNLGVINPIVAQAFETPPRSFQEVIDRYGSIFLKIDEQWKAALKNGTPPSELPDPAAESLRRVLYGPGAPCEVPDLPIVHTETFFDSGTTTKLWQLQGEVDRWIVECKRPPRVAVALVDRPAPVNTRVFVRGNPRNQGEDAPRRFLSLLSGEDRKPFQHGSGRLELAKAIIDPANPLTARVIVNRVWSHHFGQGLVTTPSDFGTRADPPSHPELLDWLASQFIAEGWSLKKLHRWILLSATFRQSAEGPKEEADRSHALASDPSNHFLWRMNGHRLSYEEFRDSMFATSEELCSSIGGKPEQLLKAPFPKRRTLYGLVDRQFLPGTLRIFDFANPDLHIPKRTETTVPQQALFFMNHPLVLDRARALAGFVNHKKSTPIEKIRLLFQQTLQREPSDQEISESLSLINSVPSSLQALAPPTAQDWHYGYGKFDEKTQRVIDFTKLPHFTGKAWQGGAEWPDPKLGWVQLTATGGHPGNERSHAAIRRWTAPRRMMIKIRSKLTHEASVGDGIRAFIIDSRVGELRSATIHKKSEDLNVEPIQVEKGETIDFVVDIGELLNSDQYLWKVSLAETNADERANLWDSQGDFPDEPVKQLSAWEQLAQTLLCSNEFLFVD